MSQRLPSDATTSPATRLSPSEADRAAIAAWEDLTPEQKQEGIAAVYAIINSYHHQEICISPASGLCFGSRDDVFCSIPYCKRCAGQNLTAACIELAGQRYKELDEFDYMKELSSMATDIQKNFLFLRANKTAIVQAASSLSISELEALINKAFQWEPPNAYYDFANLAQRDPRQPRTQFDHGATRTARDSSRTASFVASILEPRATRHPVYFLRDDDAQSQLRWSQAMGKIRSASCYVKLANASEYTWSARTMTPDALHDDFTFSAARAWLFLTAQWKIYDGLLGFCQHVLPPGDYSRGQCFIESPKDAKAAAAALLPQLEVLSDCSRALLEDERQYLPSFGGDTRHVIDEVAILEQKFKRNGRQTYEARVRAIDYCSMYRLKRTAILSHLKEDLRKFRKSTDSFLKDGTTNSDAHKQFLRTRDDTEAKVLMFLNELCKEALIEELEITTVLSEIDTHQSDWRDLYSCKNFKESLPKETLGTDPAITMFWFLCKGWTVPEKARILESTLEKSHKGMDDRYRLQLLKRVHLAVEILNVLEDVHPCVVNEADFAFYEKRFYPPVNTVALTSLAMQYDLMREDSATEWTAILWEKTFAELEEHWKVVSLCTEGRKELREQLGMPEPEEEEEELDEEEVAAVTPAADAAEEAVRTTQRTPRIGLGTLVEPATAQNTPSRRQNVRNQSYLRDYVFGARTRSRDGHHGGHGSTQLQEEVVRDRRPKRRNESPPEAATASPAANPVAPPLPAPPKLVFKDDKLYDDWRQLFPLPGTRQVRREIKWESLRRCLEAEPLGFTLVHREAPTFRYRRDARDGRPNLMIGLHCPHGANPTLTKRMLEGMKKNIANSTGFEAEDFVLAEQDA
jgi:hypothetical protein